MVAFLVSLSLTLLMAAAIVAVGRRRPPGSPLTWGEAFAASTFMFTLMFIAYGVLPHQWLAWADNELGWRSDRMVFPNGLNFGGRGRIMISWETVRDLIASGIYGAALAANFSGWLWWQKRGRKPAAAPELERSAYGRPLVRKV